MFTHIYTSPHLGRPLGRTMSTVSFQMFLSVIDLYNLYLHAQYHQEDYQYMYFKGIKFCGWTISKYFLNFAHGTCPKIFANFTDR